VIRSGRVFAWTVRLQGLSHRLEAGTYRLDGQLDLPNTVQRLLEAPLQMRKATVPEGLTLHETAGVLSRQGVVDSTRFVQLSGDPTFAASLGIDEPTLEGYLFPETYFFSMESDEETVIRRMVKQFNQIIDEDALARLDAVNLTLHQAVTLASIVEREAQAASERPLIAGVFLRRLALNRRLESCATVEYALGVHKKRLTNADLQVQSPFNTYRHRGLPPAPIGNPGKAALIATLNPEKTEYLYFVARGDGTHIFSRTNTEHEAAKRRIRRLEKSKQLN
ncbi:MAG: endolytic transglycosylase MltG, partial [Candidatus Latescibacterota bacterium]